MSVEPRVDELDMKILILMRDGYPDVAIGRKVSLSHRTVQRRICRMMDGFGIVGRFALGLRVAESQLLEENESLDTFA
ncbi:AsnC family protein [Streptomyces fildesensis]|uniref:AsnC family protein n=1 Tax=Streptomyces fildesensis TaxID=375757 RepID=A0ABW8C485_9ACTN